MTAPLREEKSIEFCREFKLSYLGTQYLHENTPLGVWKSGAGFYLGHVDDMGPVCRDSEEYWGTKEEAETALAFDTWSQRPHN